MLPSDFTPLAIAYDWLSEMIYVVGQMMKPSDSNGGPTYFTVMRGATTDFAGSHSNFETIFTFEDTSMSSDIQLTVNPLTG